MNSSTSSEVTNVDMLVEARTETPTDTPVSEILAETPKDAALVVLPTESPSEPSIVPSTEQFTNPSTESSKESSSDPSTESPAEPSTISNPDKSPIELPALSTSPSPPDALANAIKNCTIDPTSDNIDVPTETQEHSILASSAHCDNDKAYTEDPPTSENDGGDIQTSPPPAPAHMFTNARDVTIRSGNYINIVGAEIRNHGSRIDSAKTQKLQKQLKETRERYGSNADASVFEGFSGSINRAGTVRNVAGGRFSVVHDERKKERSGELGEEDFPEPQSPQDPSPQESPSTPPRSRYIATMFKNSEVNNLEYEDMTNVAGVDLSGLGLSPEDTAKVYRSIMATHEMYGCEFRAESFVDGKYGNVKMRKVTNVAGAGVGPAAWIGKN